jgi:hypothetical protein
MGLGYLINQGEVFREEEFLDLSNCCFGKVIF